MKLARFASWALAFTLLTVPAFAGEKGGVRMDDTITVDSKTLVLNGMGIREATVLNIDVYVAGLYLESKSQDASAILGSVQSKRLVLKFVRDVDRGDITKAWNEGFERNAKDQLPTLQPDITKLNSWMAAMVTGDSMEFTYVSGKGLEVKVKGTVKGTITGDAFARAFLSIWLATPPNKGLKAGLLGKE